jgi:hypothetical protein
MIFLGSSLASLNLQLKEVLPSTWTETVGIEPAAATVVVLESVGFILRV